MSYKIAVPTHRRVDMLGELTLNCLKDFNPQDIYLFISDQKDFDLYQQKYSQYNLVLTNTKDVKEKFNYVQNYFPPDQWVVVFEDDIKEVQDLYKRDLKTILSSCIQFCEKNNLKAWGVYPSSNLFYMKKDLEVGLTFLIANLFAFKAVEPGKLDVSFTSKHDYERSVLYSNFYGAVVRFNFISCKTNNYGNKGGIQEEKDQREEMEAFVSKELARLYPHIYSINEGRKSIYTELKMNKNVVKYKV